MKELFEKVSGDTKPSKPGDYMTNLGRLYFDGEAFIVPGHKHRTITVVEFYLVEYKSE